MNQHEDKNIIVKIYPKQKIYKEEEIDIKDIPLRTGRLTNKITKSIITTIYGKNECVPEVIVTVKTIDDDTCYIDILIRDYDTKTTLKYFVLSSRPTNTTLLGMKKIYDGIEELITDDTKTIIDLITYIRAITDAAINEYC